MIGCEKLCGRCVQCRSLVVQLGGDDGCPCAECGNARAAIGESASLADLLARALRGRGVSADVTYADEYPDVLFAADGDVIVYDARGITEGAMLTMTRARSALARLLAAGLCSADEALRLLEGT